MKASKLVSEGPSKKSKKRDRQSKERKSRNCSKKKGLKSKSNWRYRRRKRKDCSNKSKNKLRDRLRKRSVKQNSVKDKPKKERNRRKDWQRRQIALPSKQKGRQKRLRKKLNALQKKKRTTLANLSNYGSNQPNNLHLRKTKKKIKLKYKKQTLLKLKKITSFLPSTAWKQKCLSSEKCSSPKRWRTKQLPSSHTTQLSSLTRVDWSSTDFTSTKNASKSTSILMISTKMENTMTAVWNTKTFVVIFVMRRWTKCLMRMRKLALIAQSSLIAISLKTRYQASISLRIMSMWKSIKELSGTSAARIITLLTNIQCSAVLRMNRFPCLWVSLNNQTNFLWRLSVRFTKKSTDTMAPKTPLSENWPW